MSTQQQDWRDYEQRIVEELEEERETLERLANGNSAFAPRAEAALEWLEEHTGDGDGD